MIASLDAPADTSAGPTASDKKLAGRARVSRGTTIYCATVALFMGTEVIKTATGVTSAATFSPPSGKKWTVLIVQLNCTTGTGGAYAALSGPNLNGRILLSWLVQNVGAATVSYAGGVGPAGNAGGYFNQQWGAQPVLTPTMSVRIDPNGNTIDYYLVVYEETL